jgi:hypothetical protein
MRQYRKESSSPHCSTGRGLGREIGETEDIEIARHKSEDYKKKAFISTRPFICYLYCLE